MALTYNQQPPYIALTQSPTILSVTWDGYATSSGFQYVCDLYYWTGSQTAIPSSSNYTLVKYPNDSGAGIFDFSRILNSTLTSPNEAPNDNTKWFTYDVYFQYLSGSTYLTGSHSGTWTPARLAIDGYQLFPEQVQSSTYDFETFSPYFPVLTSGPATQSVYYNSTDNLYQNDYAPGVVFYKPLHLLSQNGIVTTGFRVEFDTNQAINYTFNTASFDTGSDGVIQRVQLDPYTLKGVYEYVFPTSSFSAVSSYKIDFRDQNGTLYGKPIKYDIECLEKWPNVQITWKNRFGEMDYYNFKLLSRNSFGVNRSQYQPQLGTWNASTLTYKTYDTAIATYLVDTNTSLMVNTDYVQETYNDIFKQLLVSDEIYWIYDPVAHRADSNVGIRPLTIKTSNVQFKTGVADKLIQYTFDFDYGQSYKLIM